MKKCKYCHGSSPYDATFCPFCAKKFSSNKPFWIILSIVGSILIIAAASGGIYMYRVLKSRADYNKTVSIPMPSPSTLPTKPVIGMSYSEFSQLCEPMKGREEEDQMRSYQSAKETANGITLGYNEKRAAKDCWGTFYFTGSELTAIYR